MILLTPGPCMTSESVRQAGALPDLNHRDPAYLDLVSEVKNRLVRVYPQMVEQSFGNPSLKHDDPLPPAGSAWVPFLIGGSGTAAVEAMLTSCVDQGPVLVIESGYYSGRFKEILTAHQVPFDVVSVPWLEPWPMPLIAEKVADYEAVVCAHHETTTGRLNPVDKLSRICSDAYVNCLVDAVSSFGADPLDLSYVHAVATSANKCLHGIPGVSMVFVRDWLMEEMSGFPRRTFYMDLSLYVGDSPPLTPPVPAVSALLQALREMPGGAAQRQSTYQQRAEKIRATLASCGLQPAIPADQSSCTLTTAQIPDGYTSEGWLAANRQHGYLLYGCKGELKEEFFQVANMGELTDEMIDGWIELLPKLLGR